MARNRSKHNNNRAEHISAGNEKEDLNDIGRLDNDSNFSLHHRNSSGVKKGKLADTSPLELPHEVHCKSIREELLPAAIAEQSSKHENDHNQFYHDQKSSKASPDPFPPLITTHGSNDMPLGRRTDCEGDMTENHTTYCSSRNSTFLTGTLLQAAQDILDDADVSSASSEEDSLPNNNAKRVEPASVALLSEKRDTCIPLSYYRGLHEKCIIQYIEDIELLDYDCNDNESSQSEEELNEFGLSTIYE